MLKENSNSAKAFEPVRDGAVSYWRVEGSLLELGAMRPVGFFTWNGRSFSERWARRAGMAGMALVRPFAYAASRTFATRFLHTLLRGVTRDRLDLLGEEYFHYVLKPQLRPEAAEQLRAAVRSGERVVLVGQLLESVLRPLAAYFGVDNFIANRLEFRDGKATGRLVDPIVRPRGPFAWLSAGATNGRIPREQLLHRLGWQDDPSKLDGALCTTARPALPAGKPVAMFGDEPKVEHLSVRQTLAGRHILLIGVTGFIGKVWLVDLLEHIPDIGKVTLLIRRNRTTAAQRRFEKIVEESPTFDTLHQRYGQKLGAFLKEKVEVVEGDVSQPGLGLEPEIQERLANSLDLIVNSAGLTDFNPDLRDALSSNVDSALYLLEFLRRAAHAGLMHLSTCYVVGMRDGRVTEELQENYNPAGDAAFDAEREIASLRETIQRIETRSESPELSKALRRQALGRGVDAAAAPAEELQGVLKRNRARWARNRLVRVGLRRAQHLGWPNIYTFTKSSGRIDSGTPGPRFTDCHSAAVYRGKLRTLAVHRLERRHQHFRAALLFVGNKFPAVAHQRTKMPGRHPRRYGVPRHVLDRSCSDCTMQRPHVSAGHFGDQSREYGAQHRADRTGAPQTLPPAIQRGQLAES